MRNILVFLSPSLKTDISCSLINYNSVFKLIKGPVAEWLGTALQKLLLQFEPGRDL